MRFNWRPLTHSPSSRPQAGGSGREPQPRVPSPGRQLPGQSSLCAHVLLALYSSLCLWFLSDSPPATLPPSHPFSSPPSSRVPRGESPKTPPRDGAVTSPAGFPERAGGRLPPCCPHAAPRLPPGIPSPAAGGAAELPAAHPPRGSPPALREAAPSPQGPHRAGAAAARGRGRGRGEGRGEGAEAKRPRPYPAPLAAAPAGSHRQGGHGPAHRGRLGSARLGSALFSSHSSPCRPGPSGIWRRPAPRRAKPGTRHLPPGRFSPRPRAARPREGQQQPAGIATSTGLCAASPDGFVTSP